MLFVLFGVSLQLQAQDASPPEFRIGASLFGASKPSCPIFISGVQNHSPAAKAGLQPGDQLLNVDGKAVQNLDDASRLISSTRPGSVVLEFLRDDKRATVTVQREDSATLLQEQGLKVLPDGVIVKADATDSEIQYLQRMIRLTDGPPGISSVAFSDRHYPVRKDIYYPGFEAFLLKSENLVIVGGTEHGPASRAGIRWGDQIVAINGVDPRGKSAAELESALSSQKPASVELNIARGGRPFTASFALEKASDVLGENDKKIVNGKIVPRWLSDEYSRCWQ